MGKSHEKAGYHRGNAYWQHDALRGPFLSACVARGSRFGGAGRGGSPGRAAGDARRAALDMDSKKLLAPMYWHTDAALATFTGVILPPVLNET